MRALAHSEASAERLSGLELDVARGDLAKPESLAAVCRGVTRLFLLTPFSPEQEQLESGALDAAERVVKVSAEFAADAEPIAVGRPHAAIERRLGESRLAATILRPTDYASNLLQVAEQIQTGQIAYPAGEARLALIDPRDIADAALAALTAEQPITGTFELRGPEYLTYAEVAERIGAALGRQITYHDTPPEAWRSTAIQAGLPTFYADALDEMYARIRQGRHDPHTNDIERLTGHPPRTLDEFLHERPRPALVPAAGHLT